MSQSTNPEFSSCSCHMYNISPVFISEIISISSLRLQPALFSPLEFFQPSTSPGRDNCPSHLLIRHTTVYETMKQKHKHRPPALNPSIPSFPMTPPDPPQPPPNTTTASVAAAVHVLSTERAALAHLEHLYQTDQLAQENLARAVDQIVRSIGNGGKLVFCGVGKSGKIAQKLEATMNSVGVYSTFLHPTEALHGDLGMVRSVGYTRDLDMTSRRILGQS